MRGESFRRTTKAAAPRAILTCTDVRTRQMKPPDSSCNNGGSFFWPRADSIGLLAGAFVRAAGVAAACDVAVTCSAWPAADNPKRHSDAASNANAPPPTRNRRADNNGRLPMLNPVAYAVPKLTLATDKAYKFALRQGKHENLTASRKTLQPVSHAAPICSDRGGERGQERTEKDGN